LPDVVALLFELPKGFNVVCNPHDGGLEHFRVDVGQLVPLIFEVGKFATNFADALFDGSPVFGNLIKAVQGVIVELSTGIAVVVQRLSLAFRGLEAIPVVVVHSTHFERDVTDVSTLAVRSESSLPVDL
jgi:hypothetical protein